MSALHNINRSFGCARLATSDNHNLVLYFVAVELTVFLLYKIARGDFYYWPRFDQGHNAILAGLFTRLLTKIITDFSGCLHLRHPYELCGLVFSLSMLWAQIFPFVALQLYEGDNESMKNNVKTFLFCSFSLWSLLNLAFFCTIDLKFIWTFFGTKTGPQYTCELFLTSETVLAKYDAVFTNRIQYTKSILKEIKEWMAVSIEQWRDQGEDWFKSEMIPNDFLPGEVFEAEGGLNRSTRKRSFFSSDIISSGRPSGRWSDRNVNE